MARYRPIAPEKAWRTASAGKLTREDRYTELYLLTSTFSNVIGCYAIAENIAAVEAGFDNTADLIAALNRIQAHGIIVYEDGHVLVRTWFYHNTWESAFTGNVAKLAQKEITALPHGLREKWALSCLEAGVPEETLKLFVTKPLTPPSIDPPKGLQHNNDNENLEQNETTTGTEHNPAIENASGGGCRYFKTIFLTPLTECHRPFIESALKDLSQEDAQTIADEVCGALEAAAKGKRKSIDGLHGWLPKVVARFHENKFTSQWGPAIAKSREENLRKAKQTVEIRNLQQDALEKQEMAMVEAESLISNFSHDDLQEFATLAETFIPTRDAKIRIRESVMQREIPPGLGTAAILQAIKKWSEISVTASDHHV